MVGYARESTTPLVRVVSVMENWIFHLVFGGILLVVIAYGYYISGKYDGRPLHWGKESKKVDVYAVKEGTVRCGYLFGNKITHDLVEVLGYSTPKNNEYFLMKSPKMVGFRGVALEDTGNLYNAAELRKALEKNGATLVSDTLYLVDKEHTEQWALN